MRKLDSKVKVRLDPTQVKVLALDSFPGATEDFLASLGVTMDSESTSLRYVMDGLPAPLTSPSVTTPVQFLQHWMPKAIEIVTQARVADRLLGRTVAGDWHDEEIVVSILEHTGHTRPYGDNANSPLANYNTNYERRTIIRFEEGLMTGKLEEARAAASATKISAYDAKRAALATSFAIDTNAVAFWGYNDGLAHTYGILNDPNLLPALQPVPNTAGDTEWSSKTFTEIVRDINTAISKLRQQTGSNFDPTADKFVLGVASAAIDYMNTLNEHGNKSVLEWFKETFPGGRVMVVPEFDKADGNQNCFYLILDRLNGSKVAEQFVPAAMRLLGVEQRAKGLFEAYTNATAGTMVEQPIGIVRVFGI